MPEIRIIDRSKIADSFSSDTGIYNNHNFNTEDAKVAPSKSKRRFGALVLTCALVSAGGGAATALLIVDRPVAQPIAPKNVPEDPIPVMPNDETSGVITENVADEPRIVDYKLSKIELGVAGKDCKPHGSYYIEPATFQITVNNKPYRLEIPKTVVAQYSCGTDVKAYIDNVEPVDTTLRGVDGSEVPVQTYRKNVLINNDSIDFTAKIVSKDIPKIVPLSAAQRLQDKAYNGENICVSYPGLEGCNDEFALTKKESAVIIATAQLFAVKAVGKLCSDNEYQAFKSANAMVFDTDAKNQYFDPDLVFETYANSALQPVTSVPNYTKGLEKVLIKKGAIQDDKKIQEIFGTNQSVVAKCEMEEQ